MQVEQAGVQEEFVKYMAEKNRQAMSVEVSLLA